VNNRKDYGTWTGFKLTEKLSQGKKLPHVSNKMTMPHITNQTESTISIQPQL